VLSLRVLGVTLAVLAMLMYLNITQVNDDNEAALRGSGMLVPDIDRALGEQRHEAESNALTEYCLLVAAGLGVLGALAGPPVLRRLSRA
jgi:hypothetical protein